MDAPPPSTETPRPSRTSRWREATWQVIFGHDTPAGLAFDLTLLVAILASVLVVMLETVEEVDARYHSVLFALEVGFTILFTIEYALRLAAVRRPSAYALSFYGVVDLLAILPTYLSLFVFGTQALTIVRAIRLLRVFRVLKLGNYLDESQVITRSLRASQRKISVFLFAILMIVMIIGAVMYLVEGETNPGFNSIPLAVYWAIVTLTTVGFGDITPQTSLGQFLSAIIMILGYAIIAVPTGIVSAEMVADQNRTHTSTQACRFCGEEDHAYDAVFCKSCGNRLNPEGL